jgi:hypothetical protein
MDWIMDLIPELSGLGLAVGGCLILVGLIIGVAIAAKGRHN